MATTLRQTSLKTTITEEVTIGGRARNSTVTKTINGIGEVFTNITEVTTTGTDLAQFAAAKGAGIFSTASSGAGQVKYLRVSNLDDTNYITLTISDNATAANSIDLFAVKVEPGKSFLLSTLDFESATAGLINNKRAASVNASASPDTITLTGTDNAVSLITDNELTLGSTIANIRAVANSASCDVEIVIASQ